MLRTSSKFRPDYLIFKAFSNISVFFLWMLLEVYISRKKNKQRRLCGKKEAKKAACLAENFTDLLEQFVVAIC